MTMVGAMIFFGGATTPNTKMDKWDCSNLKIFCTMEETTNSVKRQPRGQEKLSANPVSDKGLISKIGKEGV